MDKKRKTVFIHCLILAGYSFLTLLFTYPLIFKMSTHILGDGFDANQFQIAFWWIEKALIELKRNPFHTDYLFYPFGTSLVFHTMTFLNGLLGIPLQQVLGLTATVNLFNLLTFIFSSYGAFLLVRYFTHEYIGAFIGGCIFGFFPYRLINAMGTYHVLNTQWIPFYILFFWKLSRETKFSNSIWAGIFFLATALNEYNYALFLCLFTALHLLYLALTERNLLTLRFLQRLALCTGIFVGGLLPILYCAYQEIRLYGDFVSSESVGVDLLLFFIPSILHPVFKNAAWRVSPRLTPYLIFSTVYVGYSVLFLACYAIQAAKKEHRRIINFWLLSGLFFFLLSLGPYLQVNGKHLFQIGNWEFSIPLPHILILKIPILGGSRISGRFSVMLMLSLAVLVGYACAALMTKITRVSHRRIAWLCAGIILLAVLFEYLTFPYPHLYSQSIPQIYHDIAEEPGDFSILQIPLQFKSGGSVLAIGSSELDLAQTVHQKRLIGGYVARVPAAIMDYFGQLPLVKTLVQLQQGSPLTQDMIEQDQAFVDKFIRFFDLKYIVVHKKDRIGIGFFTGQEHPILENMERYIQEVFPIERVMVDDEAEVTTYAIQSAASSERVERVDFGTSAASMHLAHNWSWNERWNKTFPFNWANSQRSLLLLRFQQSALTSCAMRVRPFSYPNAPQQLIKIFLNGHFVTQKTLAPAWQEYAFSLPQSYVRRGINKLAFEYHYAHSPSQVLGEPDRRKLSVAFDWLECVSDVNEN